MGVADELCDELFRWMDKQEQCADHLRALATELENMREVMTAGQVVGNTATVLGSAVLIGSGIATFLTGGLAAPLLVTAAGVTVGVGTATSITLTLVEKWKSSDTIKNAEKTADEIKQIQCNIERLQKKLQEECESEIFQSLSPDDMQCEITVRILKAMAKRIGRDLPLSHLRHLLRSDDIYANNMPTFNLDLKFFKYTLSSFLVFLGYSAIFLKTAARKGQKFYTPLLVKGMANLSLKTVLKGAGQAAGGIFGLIFTVPELVENCEELIKNKHQTEASRFLKTKANEIRETVKNFREPLNKLQEMLNQIPERECHIDLSQEMFGSQIYTQGTVCIEYTYLCKQTQKQDKKTLKFIVICTKDLGVTKCGITGKDKSGGNKNKRQKKAATSAEQICPEPKREPASQRKRPYYKSKTKVKKCQYRLPKIMMSNVFSLKNKIKELEEIIEDVENFDCDLILFTETWFKENSPSISLDGYLSHQVDRDKRLTNKIRGGGLIMYVNEAWARDVEVENIINTPDYELMVVSIIPNDLPEGCPPLTYILVYIPGPNFNQAAIDIAGVYHDALEKYGGPVFLLGDFNKCDFSGLLDLEQCVTCPTRKKKTLDKCYGNVPGAYRSECRPPLGKSDHNVIYLIPKTECEDDECKHDKCRK